MITLQLDWPAELISAYHALGGTLLDLVLHPDQQASLVRHLHHFGFAPTDEVMLAVITANRRRTARLPEACPHLDATTAFSQVKRGVTTVRPAGVGVYQALVGDWVWGKIGGMALGRNSYRTRCRRRSSVPVPL